MVEAELAAGPSAQTPPPYFNRKMADHDDDVIASDRKCRAACTCVADVLPLRFPVAPALPEVTGESCPLRRHTQPPARPLLLPSPPSTLVARWGIRRRHALHTHARTHALSRSAPLPLPLSLAAAILGRSVWNNPRVPLSICARTGARACLLISPRDTHSQHTVRRAPLLCLWLQRSSEPLGEGSFLFFAQLFLRGRASLHVCPRPSFACCGSLTRASRLFGADQPAAELLSPVPPVVRDGRGADWRR